MIHASLKGRGFPSNDAARLGGLIQSGDPPQASAKGFRVNCLTPSETFLLREREENAPYN